MEKFSLKNICLEWLEFTCNILFFFRLIFIFFTTGSKFEFFICVDSESKLKMRSKLNLFLFDLFQKFLNSVKIINLIKNFWHSKIINETGWLLNDKICNSVKYIVHACITFGARHWKMSQCNRKCEVLLATKILMHTCSQCITKW